ncbi:MAG: CobW family GTP-binding protein [Thermoflexaceae bacterium]|nr:CobW family GTP-binding protein [Thermoflexaceae bacterium]
MTKINVISGFLGAGKTTLIKKLIAESFKGEKVVLIENEFGEIGIDGGFLKDAGIEITEMNSGCICCSLVGDFGTALADVITKFAPDRIIIEPSGVGKLSDVMKAVVNIAQSQPVELDSSITVADANKCKMYMKNFGEFFNNQIENADTIVLSRTQSVSDKKLEEAVSLLRTKNEKAAIITTPWDVLSGDIILEAMNKKNSLAEELMKDADVCPECGHHHEHEHEHHHDHDHEHEHHHDEECGCGHDHHHHHADEVFTSWGKETPHKYSKEDMDSILDKLANSDAYGQILRAKGIVPNVDGTFLYFDLVPGEYEIREGQPDYTGKLCVIGSNLKEDELETLFQLR